MDSATHHPLPTEAIQRVLFVNPHVHVYQIPPIVSANGFRASRWATDEPSREIFIARLRVLETAIASPLQQDSSTMASNEEQEPVKTDILLEDPSTGQLFAAAPYTNIYAVEQASDSMRFFAIRVVGEGGMKATLGIGFEDRSDAFDFGVCLQEARKVMGMETKTPGAGARKGGGRIAQAAPKEKHKRDYSLKEGESITVKIGTREHSQRDASAIQRLRTDGDALFSIKPPPPPPSSGGAGATATAFPSLAPPTRTSEVETQCKTSSSAEGSESGFDDDFGDFQ